MISAPTSQKETFALLMRLSAQRTLDEILELVDWQGVAPTQLYQAVLGRLPETLDHAIQPVEYSAREQFVGMLKCHEFQAGVINAFIRQFQEKRRLIFVHIPKCAGTDLIHNLSRYYPHLAYDHSQREWTTPDDLLVHLSRTAIELASSPDLFISGHVTLRHALDNYYRFGDEIFTVIRDPRAIILSHVNYVTNLLRTDYLVSRPDTQWWWTQLNMSPASPDCGPATWSKLALDVLHNQEITKRDLLCTMLGDGTLEGAVNTMSLVPLELVDVARYSQWLQSRWGITSHVRENEGTPILHWHTLRKPYRSHVESLCEQDRELYHLYERASAAQSTGIVQGRDLWREWRAGRKSASIASEVVLGEEV